jgi:hypothetical protein
MYPSLAKIDLFLQLRTKNHETFHNFSIFYNQILVFFKIDLNDTNSYPLLLESILILKISNLFVFVWSLKINSDTLYLIIRSQNYHRCNLFRNNRDQLLCIWQSYLRNQRNFLTRAMLRVFLFELNFNRILY